MIMATSKRLRGNQGLILKLTPDGGTEEDLGDDVKKWELNPDDADDSDLTFWEAMQGLGAAWKLNLTAIVSADQQALWRFLWSNAGKDVQFTLGPWGNDDPTATKPHFSGIFNIKKKPPVSNEARTSKEGAEFEVELECDGDVEMDDGTGGGTEG